MEKKEKKISTESNKFMKMLVFPVRKNLSILCLTASTLIFASLPKVFSTKNDSGN